MNHPIYIRRITAWYTWAGLSAIVIVGSLGYFLIGYQFIAGSEETEVEIDADLVSQLISKNPQMWTYEQLRLKELLSRQQSGHVDKKRILDSKNSVVAEGLNDVKSPVIMRSADIFDSGTVVGRVVIYRSIRHLLINTGFVALAVLLLGLIVFVPSIVFPLRAIRRFEEELQRSEEKYRIVAENTYDWEFWIDTDDRFIYTSPSCERFTGHSAEEFKADPDLLNQLVHPEDSNVFYAHRHEAKDVKTVEEIEFRIVRPDGSIRWIAHVCQPVFDSRGTFLGTRGNNRDITLRKNAEEEKGRLIVELQDALAKVKQLSGMLPICASCKKIRDDKGYWTQIESYIHEHSEAEFSHSVCPECAKKLYPGYYDEIWGKKTN